MSVSVRATVSQEDKSQFRNPFGNRFTSAGDSGSGVRTVNLMGKTATPAAVPISSPLVSQKVTSTTLKPQGSVASRFESSLKPGDLARKSTQETYTQAGGSSISPSSSQHMSETLSSKSVELASEAKSRQDNLLRSSDAIDAPLMKLSKVSSSEEVVKPVSQPAVNCCDAFPIQASDVDPSKFIKIRVLGKGAMGKVYLVGLKQEEETDPIRLFAMKVVSKEEMVEKNRVQRVMTEREVLASTSHPYIVGMYASFQTNSKLYYCMEYMAGGEFFRMLQRQPGQRISEEAAKFYTAEVILALEYLHHIGFVYRDLKPENVLMRADGHLALADFDLSKQAAPVQPKLVSGKLSLTDRLKGSLALKKSNSKLNMVKLVSQEPVLKGDCKSFVGTAEYLAPEVIEGVKQTAGVDWWTLGILMYEMIYGVTPFRGAEQKDTFANILSKDLKFPSDIPISKEGKDLIKRLLTRDPAKRLGAEEGANEVKNHKWFNGINFALIRNMEAPIAVVYKPVTDLSPYQKTMNDLEKDSGHRDSEDQSSSSSAFLGFESHKA
eukprot:CAMPEP_0182446486 /NCGR_PEP_ID=MMETSP1172-20130603/4232_1 /TAXON_ID=708627 /ORGANISM="Timspurckia oligopyrenoides, Strain CCMP3278" /LENGTH=549 /DNA_ID=CAMNT_0024642423 /DNA_START=59 /DNA_END=1708 /DNA_ORIENTATION=+